MTHRRLENDTPEQKERIREIAELLDNYEKYNFK